MHALSQSGYTPTGKHSTNFDVQIMTLDEADQFAADDRENQNTASQSPGEEIDAHSFFNTFDIFDFIDNNRNTATAEIATDPMVAYAHKGSEVLSEFPWDEWYS